MADLQGFKAYARLMPDDTDPTIKLCYDAAVQHAKGADIPEFLFTLTPSDPKLDLYIYAIALHWHDKRDLSADQIILTQTSKMRRELMYRRPTETEVISDGEES